MAIPINITATGVAYAGPGVLTSMFVAVDGTNDVQITVYDNVAAASGIEVVPTTIFDASALNMNGFTLGEHAGLDFASGLYVSIEASGGGAFGGAVEITLGVIAK